MAEPRISFDEARRRSLEKWRKIRGAASGLVDDIGMLCGFCVRWGEDSLHRECERCEAHGLCMADDSLHERIVSSSMNLVALVVDLIDGLETLEPPEGEEG